MFPYKIIDPTLDCHLRDRRQENTPIQRVMFRANNKNVRTKTARGET